MLGRKGWQDCEESLTGNSKPSQILLLGKQLTLYLNAHVHLCGPYIIHHLLCVRHCSPVFQDHIPHKSTHTYDSDLGLDSC